MPRRPRPSAAAGTVCEPPTAAEGCYGLRPQDLHRAYELPTSASTQQTIAIVDAYDDPTIEADLATYDAAFGLPACTHANGCFTKANQEGAASPLPQAEGAWAGEISLDVETAHAICQRCRIVLVEADNEEVRSLDAAEDTALALGANEISNSWGIPEADLPLAEVPMKHPGVVIAAAAGDYGYDNWLLEGTTLHTANFPASSPYVIGVGGTRLELTAAGARANETIWDGREIGGSGCSSRYQVLRWQQELLDWPAVGCGEDRAVADVSADADPYTGEAIYDSYSVVERVRGHAEPFDWGTAGGTSLSSPLIAATFALAGGAGGVEYPAETLYERVISETGTLHDVQFGSNGECPTFYPGSDRSTCSPAEEGESCRGEAICLAGHGYDGPSGLGTPAGVSAFTAPTSPLRAAQTVQFTSIAPPDAVAGGPVYEVSANASSGLAVTFGSLTPDDCAVSGRTVRFKGAGSCTIEASQAGGPGYRAAPGVTQTFSVGRGRQMLSFTTSPPASASFGGEIWPRAHSSGGLPVSLASLTPGVCSFGIGQTFLQFVGIGTCTIQATQEGDADYYEATPVEQSFEVGRGSQQVRFISSPPAPAEIGGSYTPDARASSALPVTLTSTTPTVCAVAGETVGFLASGECMIEANQAGNADYFAASAVVQSFTVSKRAQTVHVISGAPTGAMIGGTYTISANASSGLPVSLTSATPTVCAVAGETVSFLMAGQCTLEAGQAGDTEYLAAIPVAQSFHVAPAPASVALPPPAAGSLLAPAPAPAPLTTTASPLPDSSFHVHGRPIVHAGTGAIGFTVAIAEPGTVTWLLTFPNGRFGAFAASARRCRAGRMRLRRRCLPARVLFGRGALEAEPPAGGGEVSFTVRPARSARAALAAASGRRRELRVSAVVTFRSALGGPAVAHRYSVADRLRSTRSRRGRR